jgi:hypothetical protein
MQKWGFDPGKVWVRHNKVVKVNKDEIPQFFRIDLSPPRYYYNNVTQFSIGVCGYWTMGLKIRTQFTDGSLDKITIKYPGWEDISNEYIEKHIVNFNNVQVWLDNRAKILRSINKKRILYDSHLFEKFKTPVMVIEQITDQGVKDKDKLHLPGSYREAAVQIAPTLSGYNYSIVEPDVIKLWSNITQFLDNTLRTVDCPVQISDDDLRDGKGFDNKSFKNTGNRLKG